METRVERKSDYVTRYKAARGCAACGEADPVCLHLHHSDPSQKSEHLKANRTWMTMEWRALQAELAKCEVLCANCHAKEHARARRPHPGDVALLPEYQSSFLHQFCWRFIRCPLKRLWRRIR